MQNQCNFVLCLILWNLWRCTIFHSIASDILPLSQKNLHSSFVLSQTILSSTSLYLKNTNIYIAKQTPPMLSQHSRFQAVVKEEGCDRFGEPTLNLVILIKTKSKRNLLGHNPLSDTPY
jgi:hypothetical protein